jgi:hypothetical protein
MEFREFNRSFSDVGAFRTGEANLTAGDRALRVRSAIVDAPLLKTLGVQAAEGRLFTPADAVVSNPTSPAGPVFTQPVVVLSYEIWQSAFGTGRSSAAPLPSTDARWRSSASWRGART